MIGFSTRTSPIFSTDFDQGISNERQSWSWRLGLQFKYRPDVEFLGRNAIPTAGYEMMNFSRPRNAPAPRAALALAGTGLAFSNVEPAPSSHSCWRNGQRTVSPACCLFCSIYGQKLSLLCVYCSGMPELCRWDPSPCSASDRGQVL